MGSTGISRPQSPRGFPFGYRGNGWKAEVGDVVPGVPESIWNTDFIDRFYEGWHALAGEINVELVGGDVSKSPEKLVIDSVVGGEVAKGKAIMRSGAKAGDAIFVTGTLGGSAGGLKLLERGFEILEDLPDLASNLLIRHLKTVATAPNRRRIAENRGSDFHDRH